MKTGRFLLWSVALLLVVHCIIAMVTFPEFHVVDHVEFQEHLDKISTLSSNSKEVIQMELIKGRWNGQYGENLAELTLAIDVLMFVAVGGLIVSSYRGQR